MSGRRWFPPGLGLLLAVAVARPALADFSAAGRSRKTPPSVAAPKKAPQRSSKPAGPAPAPEAADGRAPREDTSALFARYTALVLSRPGETFPLDRLVQLYRERDGNLARLIDELSLRADRSGPEKYAATLALAGALRRDGQLEKAVETYERAISEAKDRPLAEIALADLLAERGDKAGARARLEHALPRVTVDADREPLLRKLVGLCLDSNDSECARRYHQEIVTRAKGSFFARAELGRELLSRGDDAGAETEFRKLVKESEGDNRALAPALRDLGLALLHQGKTDEATQVLRRALGAAGSESGLRREILAALVDVYRRQGGVAEVVSLLEREHPDDFERLTLLGGLYEETGRVSDAFKAYERALARKDDLATRLKVVQLLQVEGRLDEAVKQYERLIRSSPRDPDLVFQFSDALIQRGDRARALSELSRLEARAGGDVDTLTALAQYYEKIEESQRAAPILDRLAKSGGADPRHWVDLGDYYYRQGDTKRALETWERIRTVVPDRARALHAYGEVLLEHDLSEKALAALQQAADLAPKEVTYRKALALALERSGSGTHTAERTRAQESALRIWEKLLEEAGQDRALAREARQHIVTLWSLAGNLEGRARPLERRLAASPPDLVAGKLLAEVYGRLRRPADSERVLSVVARALPGDGDTRLALERALVSQKKLARAIEVLGELVKIDPRRAREFYDRMAQYSAELYRDADAVQYASRAVELNPDDAEGHRKLGELYKKQEDVPHAIAELRLALAKNDRLFPVYFDLSELLLSQNQPDEADRLLERVIRTAPDDELVTRAARLSMQVNLGRGTLEALEHVLLPLSVGNPRRPVFRRLLVETYGSMAFPLVHEAKSSDPARRTAARAELAKIGERAVKSLLDALSDDRSSQQRTAIELLSHVSNRSAGPALVAFATGKADAELRARGMIAVGSLADPGLLPALRSVLAPSGNVRVDESDTVAVAAAWAVARMRSPRARPLLADMLSSDAPSVRALGAVGLGLLGKGTEPRLAAMATSPEEHPVSRAAAGFAVAALGGSDAARVARALSSSPDPLARSMGLLGLARAGGREAERVVLSALFSPEDGVRAAAVAGALVLGTREYRMGPEPLPVPEGRVDLREALGSLVPTGYSAEEVARTVVALAPSLAEAASANLAASPESARAVADALLARDGAPAFSPLTDPLATLPPEAAKGAAAALEKISAALVEPLVALSRHPTVALRARAIRFLSRRPEPEARAATAQAVSDADPVVQEAALSSLSGPLDPATFSAVARLAEQAGSWPVRARAAEALTRTLHADGAALPLLARIAERDGVDFVREAAVRGLGTASSPEARAALQRVAARDPEIRIRELSKALLERR